MSETTTETRTTGLAMVYSFVSKAIATISFRHAGHKKWAYFTVLSEQDEAIESSSSWNGETLCTIEIDGCAERLRITKEQVYAMLNIAKVSEADWFEDDKGEAVPLPISGEAYNFSHFLQIKITPPDDPRGNPKFEFRVKAN